MQTSDHLCHACVRTLLRVFTLAHAPRSPPLPSPPPPPLLRSATATERCSQAASDDRALGRAPFRTSSYQRAWLLAGSWLLLSRTRDSREGTSPRAAHEGRVQLQCVTLQPHASALADPPTSSWDRCSR